VEGVFCELRLLKVLRSPQALAFSQVHPWLCPSVPPGCTSPSAWTRASAKYNGAVGYLISAAEGQTSVDLTDPQWRALIYVASEHGFSAPHLRLEGEDETLEVDGSDAEGLRSALGKALETRDTEEIRTPDGELDYDTIQRVRHVLLSEGVRLARPRAWKAGG
jgi:hypothetical protein